MNKPKIWGIVGAGWLGLEIVSRLNQAGIKNWSTHRNTFDWHTDAFPKDFSDILFLNTPPLTNLNPEDFVEKIPADMGKIIFISSTSVYGSATGPVSESTNTQPETKNAIWLVQVEDLLLNKFGEKISIIRPGGLIGGERHPIYSLAKKPNAIIEEAPINMIHRDDLIEIIFAVSEITPAPKLVNAVTPYHPMKSEYYGAWAKKLNMSELKFAPSWGAGKIVTSEILPGIYSNWINPKLDRS